MLWAGVLVSLVLAYMPMAASVTVNREHKRDRESIHYLILPSPKIVARVPQFEPPEFALPGRYVAIVASESLHATINAPIRFRHYHHRRHHH